MKLTALFPFFIFLVAHSSCSNSPAQHKKRADTQVSKILKETEKHVFKNQKKMRSFSIDTQYAKRNPSSVSAQEILKQSQRGGTINLSIEQALNYAVNHSREYQAQKERLYLAALNLTSARNDFSLIKRSSGNANVTNEEDGDVPLRGRFTQRASQRLIDGTSYTVTLANDLLRFFSGDPRRSVASVLSANIVQPLFRGRGRTVAAERLTQSSRNVIYAMRDFNQFQNNFSQEIVINYLNLLEQEQRVQNQYENYQSRKQNTAYLQARSVDRASPQEVSDSKQGELQAKNSWINAKSSYQTALDNFKLTIGLPTSTKINLKKSELKKVEQVGLPPIHFSRHRAFSLALKKRLPLLNEIDRFEDSKRQVKIAADNLRIQVDLIGDISLRSTDDGFANFDFDNLETELGVELDLPINQVEERNAYRQSLIRFESQARSLRSDFDSLHNLIERRMREIEQFKQNYKIQKGAVTLAKRRVEGNALRFKAGSIIFRRLSESQDALIDAQNAVTAALIDYQRARLQLYTELGILDASKSQFWLKKRPTTN